MPIRTRIKSEYICDVTVKYKKLFLGGACEWIPDNSWSHYVKNEDIEWLFLCLVKRFDLGYINNFTEPCDIGAKFSLSTFDRNKFPDLCEFCRILADLVDSGFHFTGVISGGLLNVETPSLLRCFEKDKDTVH